MDVNRDSPLASQDMQVLLTLFKQDLRAQFGCPISNVMVQDSPGCPGPVIQRIIFPIPFFFSFHEELLSYLNYVIN